MAKPIIGLDKGKMGEMMDSNDAEARRQTVRSLIQVVETIGVANVPVEYRLQILDTFYKCFDDYAVDRRGDVGSWVRQEAMLSLHEYVRLILESTPEVQASVGANTAEFFEKFVAHYLQQVNEKIDRIREHAGKTL
jgi:hypothetical protein